MRSTIQSLAQSITNTGCPYPLGFEATRADQETRLIRQAQSGDLEAFNQLVLIYQDSVFNQAFWFLNEEQAAEDAAQEAFIRAFRKLNTFLGGPLRPWLLKITTNYCLDQLRKAKARPTLPLEIQNSDGDDYEPYWCLDSEASPEQVMEKSELMEEIAHTIQNLPIEYRLPIILVDVQELDYTEAAALLHLPMGTLKSRLARARGKLSAEIGKRGVYRASI